MTDVALLHAVILCSYSNEVEYSITDSELFLRIDIHLSEKDGTRYGLYNLFV